MVSGLEANSIFLPRSYRDAIFLVVLGIAPKLEMESSDVIPSHVDDMLRVCVVLPCDGFAIYAQIVSARIVGAVVALGSAISF